MKVLPHRYPFLLVDRILEIEEKRIVGLKNVTINEPFFQGHFPGHPIMPGVLIVEAMAQVGGCCCMGPIEVPESKVVYFMSLDNVKFRKPVRPGDQIVFEVEIAQIRGHDVQDARGRARGRRSRGARPTWPRWSATDEEASIRPRSSRRRDARRATSRSARSRSIGPSCEVGDGCVIAPRATLERNVRLDRKSASESARCWAGTRRISSSRASTPRSKSATAP